MLVVQPADLPDSLYFVADVKEGKVDSNWSFLPKKRSIHNGQTQRGRTVIMLGRAFSCNAVTEIDWEIKCHTDLLSASNLHPKVSHHPSIDRVKSIECRSTERKEGNESRQSWLCNLAPEGRDVPNFSPTVSHLHWLWGAQGLSGCDGKEGMESRWITAGNQKLGFLQQLFKMLLFLLFK